MIKVGLWTATGPIALERAPIATAHPYQDWAEQDAAEWWPAVLVAARRLPETPVACVACTGARETVVPVDDNGGATGPAVLWSDGRAATTLARLQWLAAHQPAVLAAARWLVTPRDHVAMTLTGTVATDTTMASVSGMYDAELELLADASPFAGQLPPVVAPGAAIGSLTESAAAALGVRAGVPVVLAAGDRQCEAVGVGASPDTPMVSWGTTANVSTPWSTDRGSPPPGLRLTRATGSGWLAEGGTAAAGSLLDWLASLTGTGPATLMAEAATVPPGADGAVSLPWLGGARAPWWRADVGAAFLQLGPRHGRAHITRAAIEGVAYDVARCVPPGATALALAGGGARVAPWPEVLSGVSGLPLVYRRHADAASAGAAIIASAVADESWPVDDVNPLASRFVAPADVVATYAAVRAAHDEAAAAIFSTR